MATSRWKLVLANYSGIIYTVVIIIAITVLNLFHTCPALYGKEECFWPFAYASVILVELGANLALFHYFNSRNQIAYWTSKSNTFLSRNYGNRLDSVSAHSTPQELYDRTDSTSGTDSSKLCVECNIITPKRCHHCPLCNICVLRKDHHCFLIGGCVGLANQRYFIVFLFWAAIGSLYGTMINFAYLNRFVTPWYPTGWLCYIGPVTLIRWLLGYEQFFNMCLCVLFSMSFASFVGALAFFVLQMFYTSQGYTMHDYHGGRLRDQLESDGNTFDERIALVFGKRWLLNFIFPQFWLRNQMTHAIARNVFMSISKDL
ncbi:DHHC palmitoyltransferase domain-containing protein [Ditylenchus destructor]|uniref:Palmitoyltransferase n=1 Tax=Ditylenchus destructor TaxID=166010 RepID=A0AAD4N3D7_9BILA|nr:DHHC palmitoyltransferase domain-containing protein [Ditylenchus destructor]